MENYTFITRNDTISMNPEPLFVDPYGYTDSVPPNETNDYYESFPVRLRNPSICNKCRFVGHHRKCPSPKKRGGNHYIFFDNDNSDEDYAKEAWNNQHKQELEQHKSFNGHKTDAATYPSTVQFQMKHKAKGNSTRFKSASIPYGHQHDVFTNEFHETARERSERIFNQTWNDKERIRARNTHLNVPFTRIERAFVAVSTTTEGEIKHDKKTAKTVAVELKSEMAKAELQDLMKVQQSQIETLTQELEELRRDHQLCTPSVTSHHPEPVIEPPMMIRTSNITQDIPSTAPALGEISYTMGVMLEKYETLDEDSKNELLKYAISTGNENLQSRLLMLCQSKTGTSLTKLTKELIKLAESYKVPELKFDEQASK
jgi:hypothetical protein